MRSARHVCIKVPSVKDATLRKAYETQCANREEWVTHQLGEDGVYVGRPKNDGGWYLSPTVKAGSMFANPFSLKDFSLDESLRLFRRYLAARASEDATTERVISLLPSSLSHLAKMRHEGGMEREAIGRSTAHLKLLVVGAAFRRELCELHGLKLGCFCDESSPCHAKVIAELAATLAQDDGDDVDDCDVYVDPKKRKRDEAE